MGTSYHESAKFRPDVVSGSFTNDGGDLGIMQFNPDTARFFKIDALNVDVAIDKAGWYLSDLNTEFKDWTLALLAYNWGKGNVRKMLAGTETICDLRPRNYPVRVMNRAWLFGFKPLRLHASLKC